MSLFMMNLRMRRVEEIRKHSRWDSASHYKAYQGSRMWMLTDANVFDSEAKALKALKWQLERLKHEANQRYLKLVADLKLVDAAIAEAATKEVV